jgi:GT2 family glycosyltransferase
MPRRPHIGVVVVHFGATDLTLRCLTALVRDRQSPPTRIVVVDNGPGVGVEALVRRELPGVEVCAPGRNVGFAAGANRGIEMLDDVDLIALVNNDAVVDPGWLNPLVEALESDSGLASASPKILFEGTYHELRLATSTTWQPGRGDKRRLGWHFEGIESLGAERTVACQLVEGFWEPGRSGVWAGPEAVLRVPAASPAPAVRLRVGTPPGVDVVLHCDGALPATSRIGAGAGVCELVPNAPAVRVINNVGNVWRHDGYGLDLGFHEVDRGQHDVAGPIPAWCGGAVLLRRAYLESAGLFDERLFLYYEDLDLARRGAALGWRYWYEPRSVVSHRHAAAAGQQPERSDRLKERNRLLVVATHDGGRAFARELLKYVLVTLSYVRRDVVAPVLRGAAPETASVAVRCAAACAALWRAPGHLRRRRVRPHRESRSWPDC